jgi:hypothetical protein
LVRALTTQLLQSTWALLAEAEPDRRGAIRRFWWLWIGLFLLSILLVRIVAAIGRRRRQAIESTVRGGPVKPIKDAWEEAGKRAAPLPESDFEDQE